MIHVQKKNVSVARAVPSRRRLGRLIRSVVGAIVGRRRRRGPSVVDLRNLSEHIKRDIGLSP